MMKGEDVVRDLFGAILTDQGRGFYVALEFMALLRGTLDHDDTVLPSPTGEPIAIRRRSHDFARRLMGEPRALALDETVAIQGERALDTLAALGRGIRAPVPGRRRRMPWYAEHFQPFVGELIHYDAVYRRARKGEDASRALEVGGEQKRISVERYLYRGAGGLAHAILRTDPDAARLGRNRSGLRKLVSDSGTPLGELFAALSRKDMGLDEAGSFKDTRELEAVDGHDRGSPWVDQIRDGVRRIVERSLPRAKLAEALMHWVPYAIARYQADVAFRRMNAVVPPIPIDLGSGATAVRRRSRDVHERCRALVVMALELHARESAPHVLEKGRSKTWRNSARSFFSGTMSAVGALNATTGKRHFVLGNELLEAIVLAQVDNEMPFEQFCSDILHDRLGLVVDRASALRSEELGRLNRSDFETNADLLANRMKTLGLLVRYSDATRMVRSEVAR